MFTTLPIIVVAILLDDDFSGMKNLGPLTLKWLPVAIVVGVLNVIVSTYLMNKYYKYVDKTKE